MRQIFRSMKTHYPRTYFLLKKESHLYLLFWLEYGKDNSLYVWFDDDRNKGWEVTAKHNQEDVVGMQEISFEEETLNIFNPHISWHQSGRIHVSGYDDKGERGERLISDKKTDSFQDLKKGLTVPITQIVFPVTSPEKTLKSFGKGPREMYGETTLVGILDKKGFRVANNKAPAEAFFIIDEEIIPKGYHLAVDICAHHKNLPVSFIGPSRVRQDMLFPQVISLHKEKTLISADIRIFKVEASNRDAQESKNAVATCFNRESIDLFLFHRI